jgi:hypothetical protein
MARVGAGATWWAWCVSWVLDRSCLDTAPRTSTDHTYCAEDGRNKGSQKPRAKRKQVDDDDEIDNKDEVVRIDPPGAGRSSSSTSTPRARRGDASHLRFRDANVCMAFDSQVIWLRYSAPALRHNRTQREAAGGLTCDSLRQGHVSARVLGTGARQPGQHEDTAHPQRVVRW